MDYITLDIQQYLKAIVTPIGYQIPMIQSPQVDIYLHLVVMRYHENLLNKLALLDPLWNLSLLHWIKLAKKLNGFVNS